VISHIPTLFCLLHLPHWQGTQHASSGFMSYTDKSLPTYLQRMKHCIQWQCIQDFLTDPCLTNSSSFICSCLQWLCLLCTLPVLKRKKGPYLNQYQGKLVFLSHFPMPSLPAHLLFAITYKMSNYYLDSSEQKNLCQSPNIFTPFLYPKHQCTTSLLSDTSHLVCNFLHANPIPL
jgi:hypothetical protein